MRRAGILILVVALFQAIVHAQEAPATRPSEKPLVYIREGNWPIILSAPHGGTLPIPDAPLRTGEQFLQRRGVKNDFSTAFDRNTDKITLAIADEIEKLTGHRPYVVVANFSRRYCDANRVPEQAYECDAAKEVYETYHNAIVQFRRQIIAKWKRGLIIDIHGQGRSGQAEKIIRGTADWTSVRHLVEEFGKESLIGPEGLLGMMAADGIQFTPDVSRPNDPEYAALNGGFITRNYGSYQGGAFDAIQFEIGTTLRKDDRYPEIARKTAAAVAAFTKSHLLIGKPKSPSTQPTPVRGE